MNFFNTTDSISWNQVFILVIIWAAAIWIAKPIFEKSLTIIIKRAQIKSNRSQKEKDQRARTIVNVFSTTAMVSLTIIVAMVALAALGFNIAPLIAGAGVAGFAIGFGSQNLVRDIINGLFIVIEDQLGVGDVVEISGVRGKVEEFNLRRTTLRDEQGVAHYFPNNQIGRVANMSQDWAYLLVYVKISCDEDTDKIIKLLNKITQKIMIHPQYAKLFHDNLEVDGLEELGGGTMTFRVRAKVEGGSQWKLKRQLLTHIKTKFGKAGISIK
jgi:small conductance mechanosensitive channel